MKNNRMPLIAANWKCNQRWDDCEAFVAGLQAHLPDMFDPDLDPAVDLLVCPPYPYIALLGTLLEEAAVYLGAQDVSQFGDGAYTGSVSAGMLEDLDCDYVIIGHSERRGVFGDSDELVGEKLAAVQQAGPIAILCVGEPLDVREDGRAEEYTLAQLTAVKDQLHRFEADQLVIAYEPIWAIGTGKVPTIEQITEVHDFIRDALVKRYGDEGNAIRVLYGGSVKPSNAAEIFAVENVDGALVGGASLKADDFSPIVAALEAAKG